MKLSYRGQTHEFQPLMVAVTITRHNCQFFGQPYTLKPLHTKLQMPAAHLCYRGVDYIK